MKVKLPENLLQEDHYLFPNLSYSEAFPKLTHVNNAYVTKSGIVFKHFRVLKASIHQYKYLYWTFFKIAVANFLLKRKVRLSTHNKYIVIHNVWCPGFYHWVC